MTDACIIGWAHSPFGKLEDCPDLETLMARVARAAIEDAGIAPEDVDAGFVDCSADPCQGRTDSLSSCREIEVHDVDAEFHACLLVRLLCSRLDVLLDSRVGPDRYRGNALEGRLAP